MSESLSMTNSSPRRPSSWHWFHWTARRARRRWTHSLRGRDGYVYRHGPFRYEVTRIDYVRRPHAHKTDVLTNEVQL